MLSRFKDIKKWVIPLVFICVGIGFFLSTFIMLKNETTVESADETEISNEVITGVYANDSVFLDEMIKQTGDSKEQIKSDDTNVLSDEEIDEKYNELLEAYCDVLDGRNCSDKYRDEDGLYNEEYLNTYFFGEGTTNAAVEYLKEDMDGDGVNELLIDWRWDYDRGDELFQFLTVFTIEDGEVRRLYYDKGENRVPEDIFEKYSVMEGSKTWTKLSDIPGETSFEDTLMGLDGKDRIIYMYEYIKKTPGGDATFYYIWDDKDLENPLLLCANWNGIPGENDFLPVEEASNCWVLYYDGTFDNKLEYGYEIVDMGYLPENFGENNAGLPVATRGAYLYFASKDSIYVYKPDYKNKKMVMVKGVDKTGMYGDGCYKLENDEVVGECSEEFFNQMFEEYKSAEIVKFYCP